MNKRLFYPAVFHRAEEGGFWVTFPDIPECMTQGEDMQEAYEMAADALGLSLTTIDNEGETLPKASSCLSLIHIFPRKTSYTDNEIVNWLKERIHELPGSKYFAVIQIDHEY